MLISAETCRNLAKVVLADSKDRASAEGPFAVRDRKENWMVVGSSVDGENPYVVRRTFYMFIRKSGAEVTGIGYCIDFATDKKVEAEWRRLADPKVVAAWERRPEVQPSPVTLDLYGLQRGGLINQPQHAVTYAEALIGSSRTSRQKLEAVEKSGIWHISAADKTILAFARRDGRIVFPA